MTTTLLAGDCVERLAELEVESVQCAITSPPYWGLRDYGTAEQIGLEATPEAYVARLVEAFRAVRRVLRRDGTLWLVVGDTYASRSARNYAQTETYDHGHRQHKDWEVQVEWGAGVKHKDLVGIPWMLAFALRADGWWLRSDIVWAKPNPMPESITDRPTSAHEHVFLLAKAARYFYDADAIREQDSGLPAGNGFAGRQDHRLSGGLAVGGTEERWRPGGGRNRRDVWTVSTQPYPDAHFAVFPTALVEPCLLAGSRVGDAALDPFCGSGTVGVVARWHGRSFVGIDANPAYIDLAAKRIHVEGQLGRAASRGAPPAEGQDALFA